eukprot:4266130-Amphidinium_carterae.2
MTDVTGISPLTFNLLFVHLSVVALLEGIISTTGNRCDTTQSFHISQQAEADSCRWSCMISDFHFYILFFLRDSRSSSARAASQKPTLDQRAWHARNAKSQRAKWNMPAAAAGQRCKNAPCGGFQARTGR